MIRDMRSLEIALSAHRAFLAVSISRRNEADKMAAEALDRCLHVRRLMLELECEQRSNGGANITMKHEDIRS